MSVEGIKKTVINTCAFEAVDEIIKDLNDRQGLDSAWDARCTRCGVVGRRLAS